MHRVYNKRRADAVEGSQLSALVKPDFALPATKKIKSIRYGLWSEDKIAKYACVHVTDHRMEKSKAPELTSVYSPMLGTTERGMPCVTCKKGIREDEGHFGMLDLAVPKFKQEWLDDAKRVLQCVCFGCGMFKGHLDPVKTRQILKQCKSDNKKRLQALSIHCAKITRCEMKDTKKRSSSLLPSSSVTDEDLDSTDLEDVLQGDDLDLGDMVEDPDAEDIDQALDQNLDQEPEPDTADIQPDIQPDAQMIDEDDALERELLEGDDDDEKSEKTDKRRKSNATSHANVVRMTDTDKMEQLMHSTLVSGVKCCGTVQPVYQKGIGWIMATFTVPFDAARKKKFPRFHPGIVRRVLQSISAEDMQLMGMDPDWSKPEDMMWSKFFIPPTTIRPSMKTTESGKSKGHDDLTVKLVDIAYYNNELQKKLAERSKSQSIDDAIPNMYVDYRWLLPNGSTISCTCKHPTTCECVDKDGKDIRLNKDAQPCRSVQTSRSNMKAWSIEDFDTEVQLQINAYTTGDMKMLNSKSSGAGNVPTKQIKSLQARLVGKHGRLRGNIMGRRQNFSARTVIVPDARLDLDEISFPESFASILTYSEPVTNLNIHRLNKLLRHGGIQFIQKANGQYIGIKYAKRQWIRLEVGDTVQRKLQNGDIVLFNRQPSLHAPSIQAMRIRICKQKVFGMHPNATGPFNADFDGDEMNIWVLQDELTRAEAMELITTQNYMVWTQSASAIIAAKQNPVAGLFYLTRQDTFLTRDQVNQILVQFGEMRSPETESQHFERWKTSFPEPAILKPQPLWTGKQVMSMFLPKDYYHGELDKLDKLDDTHVVIRDNELLVGQLTDAILGGKPGAFIHRMFRDYSPAIALRFLSGIHRVANWCLEQYGLTTSVSDISVLETAHKQDAVNLILAKTLYWCDQLSLLPLEPKISDHVSSVPVKPLVYNNQTYTFPDLPVFTTESDRERFVVMMLDKLRDLVGRHVIQASRMSSQHHIVGLWDMIRSGAKGKEIHMTQLIGCLGQQKLFGLRMCMSSPHFSGSTAVSESKGFIPKPFMHGLSATEFFFHAIGGREGLVDTAEKTAQTGYLQRCLIKFMENHEVQYDGTVRDSSNHILEYRYGNQGWDPTHLERVSSRALQSDTLDKLASAVKYDSRGEPGSDLWNQLAHIRRLAISSMTAIRRGKLDSVIYSPVPFDRLLSQAKYKIQKSRGASVSRPMTIDQLTNAHHQLWDRLCKTFPQIFQDHTRPMHSKDEDAPMHSKDAPLHSKDASETWKPFELLYRDWCFPHYLASLGMTEEVWTWIQEQIVRYVAMSIVAAGEMVGTKAGQCIGETGTQATLRTFHFAGMASNAVLGFPRFKEIAFAKKQQNSPMMSIVLRPGLSLAECHAFCDRLQYQTLEAFLKRYDVVDVPEKQEDAYASEWSPVKLMFYVSAEACRKSNLSIGQMIESITAYIADYLKIDVGDELDQHVVKIRVEESNQPSEWCISVQFHAMRCHFVSAFMRQTSMMTNSTIHHELVPLQIRQFWLATCDRFARDIIVKGIPGIESASITNNNEPESIAVWDDATQTCSTREQYRIETRGSNLREVLILPEVDKRYTSCNNMFEIYDLFGAEATRVWLFENLVQLLNDIGAFVMYPHLNLLTRTMMRLGRISGIKRNDIHSQEESILKVMMFENPMEYVKNGALFAIHNKVKGVTDSIVVNSRGPMGTGIVNLVEDKQKEVRPISILDPESSWKRAEPLFDMAQHVSTTRACMDKMKMHADWQCVSTSVYNVQPLPVHNVRPRAAPAKRGHHDKRRYEQSDHQSRKRQKLEVVLDNTFDSSTEMTDRKETLPIDSYSPSRASYSPTHPTYGSPTHPTYGSPTHPTYGSPTHPTYAPGSPIYVPISPGATINPYDGMDDSLMEPSFTDPANQSTYAEAMRFLAPLQHLLAQPIRMDVDSQSTGSCNSHEPIVFRPCSPPPEWLQSSECDRGCM
jgi:DNA-directed RNA polymerase II subunit RPB1